MVGLCFGFFFLLFKQPNASNSQQIIHLTYFLFAHRISSTNLLQPQVYSLFKQRVSLKIKPHSERSWPVQYSRLSKLHSRVEMKENNSGMHIFKSKCNNKLLWVHPHKTLKGIPFPALPWGTDKQNRTMWMIMKRRSMRKQINSI